MIDSQWIDSHILYCQLHTGSRPSDLYFQVILQKHNRIDAEGGYSCRSTEAEKHKTTIQTL